MSNALTPNHHTHLEWMRVIALAIAAFVFNTTEFIPIAMLTDIGISFDLPVEKVGIMITIYAWVVALASLPLMLLCSTCERKRLLTVIFILFILSHVVTFYAGSFTVLIGGRIGVAIAHAIFWSITSALAIRVAPIGKRSVALGILATGTALATILGIPLGRIIGQMIGWRYTFLLIGVIALITLIVLVRLLPRLPSQNSGNYKSLPLILKRPALLLIFSITAMIITAHFTIYSYIEPFSELVAQMSQSRITLLLLVFGGAGIVGSIIFGKFNSKYPLAFLPMAAGLLVISLLLLLPSLLIPQGIFIVAIFWGIAITCLTLVLQLKVLDLADDATDIAMAIYSGIYNIGIGGGALVGMLVITHLNLRTAPMVAFAIAMIALSMTIIGLIHYRQVFLKASAAREKSPLSISSRRGEE